MKSKTTFKALICDIDGTLVPNNRNGIPSKKVIEAVNKASQKIHFGVATARPYFVTKRVIEHLELSGPSIVHGGAQIIDLTSGKVLKEQKIAAEDILKVFEITQGMNLIFKVDEETESVVMSKNWKPHDVLGAYIPALTLKIAELLEKELSHISTISAHLVLSWDKGKVTVDISHTSVGKQYGILEVAEILGIKTHEIIGVGDGYNDFPFLMACGLKVAMGNAVPELKAIADYIAPSVEEDGLVDVLERFIL